MDLYESIGALAATAHANGDRIDGNVRPEDDGDTAHGLDVSHQGWHIRLRAANTEPRFEVQCPYLFSAILRNQYTLDEIATRRGVDLESLSGDELKRHANALVADDLIEAEERYDDFQSLLKEQIRPVEPEIRHLAYGEQERWNGFIVKDYLYPSRESFDIVEYRQIIGRVRETTSRIAMLASEELEFLSHDPAEQSVEVEQEPREETGPIGFH